MNGTVLKVFIAFLNSSVPYKFSTFIKKSVKNPYLTLYGTAFLLKNTSLSVEEIALAVGYENKSYFHRIFNAKYGTSPKKYKL